MVRLQITPGCDKITIPRMHTLTSVRNFKVIIQVCQEAVHADKHTSFPAQ